MWRALGTASPAVREKPFVRHRWPFVRLTRRFALQGGDCVDVFPRGRFARISPVALIRPSATFSRGAGEAVCCVCCGFDRPPTGVEKVWMFLRVVGVWNSARSPSSGLRPPSPAVREKPFVRHRGTFVRFTRRFALQGGDCVIVFPRGRRVEVGPVALIRRCWPPSPAVREKRFGAITVWWSGSAGGSYQNGNRACVEANRWFSASRECPTPYSVGLLGASPSRAEAAHAFTRVVA